MARPVGRSDAPGVRPARPRPGVLLPTVVFVVVTAVSLAAVLGPATASVAEWAVTTGLFAPSVVVGFLLALRVPGSSLGPALAWVGTGPSVVLTLERWARTAASPMPWPGSVGLSVVAPQAIWPLIFVGLLNFLLVFPDGPLPGRCWRVTTAGAVIVPVLLSVLLALHPSNYAADGGPAPGRSPVTLPEPVWIVLVGLGFGSFVGVLAAAGVSLVLRYRRGAERTRLRVRWLALVGVALPALLVASWITAALGVPAEVGFTVMLAVFVLAIPTAVAIAVLRHDLFDVDRLLGEGLAWLLTTLVSAGVFAVVVVTLTPLLRSVAGDATSTAQDPGGIDIGLAVAAFVAALVVLPVHRRLMRLVGKVIDRERWVVLRQVEQFVDRVRDGAAAPESVEQVLRAAIGDPDARLLGLRPGPDRFVDLQDREADPAPTEVVVPLRSGDEEVGVLALSSASARRLRRARDALMRARLPIEVSRLRLELRRALADVSASRTRLALAAEGERRRLERDLHDGAQQSIVAVGMTLRSVQRQLEPGAAAWTDLDRAVATLEATVAELRRLAHGLRPAGLDGGLETALRRLADGCPVPTTVRVAVAGPSHQHRDDDVTRNFDALSATTTETVWFVVAEALTNVLRHARAGRVLVTVELDDRLVRVTVEDDGIGGVQEGFGLGSLRDRVGTAGGELNVDSAPGRGTTVRAEVPCAS